MSEARLLVVDVLAIAGTLGTSLAVLGMVRLRDDLSRIQAAAVAPVVGVLLVCVAALAAGAPGLGARAVLVGVVLLVTGSVGIHVLAAAAAARASRTGDEDGGEAEG